jgi:hypothetical protein
LDQQGTPQRFFSFDAEYLTQNLEFFEQERRKNLQADTFQKLALCFAFIKFETANFAVYKTIKERFPTNKDLNSNSSILLFLRDLSSFTDITLFVIYIYVTE